MVGVQFSASSNSHENAICRWICEGDNVFASVNEVSSIHGVDLVPLIWLVSCTGLVGVMHGIDSKVVGRRRAIAEGRDDLGIIGIGEATHVALSKGEVSTLKGCCNLVGVDGFAKLANWLLVTGYVNKTNLLLK